ncbi:MAG TPA: aldo/keto reductase [Candidatus Dormibacteraeota bacterium]|nr:aldo/keto reductase [Candidatus Dormibacteraeota bacterium]
MARTTVTRGGFLAGTIAATSVSPALTAEEVPQRVLGRTGERVSAVGLGGFHIGIQGDERESIRLIRGAIDAGITFMDNCWDYNGGESEIRMGKALRDGYRQKVFLMTKIDGRDRRTAAAQLDESLRRLQTDHLDLLQFHEVIRTSDPQRIFARGGAMEAVIEARRAGKVRYVGFTGHKSPAIHVQMLETAEAHGFTFDAVQMPLNVMDAHFESFERQVLPVLARRGIAALGMKPLADRFVLESGTVTPIEALQYAMSLPVSVVITGIDSQAVLKQALRAAGTFRAPDETQRRALLLRTAAAARGGRYEPYKTTQGFDGTSLHPQWLG